MSETRERRKARGVSHRHARRRAGEPLWSGSRLRKMMANPTDAAIDSRAFPIWTTPPACACCHRAGMISLHAVL